MEELILYENILYISFLLPAVLYNKVSVKQTELCIDSKKFNKRIFAFETKAYRKILQKSFHMIS